MYHSPHLPTIFPKTTRREIRELFTAALIFQFALALSVLFEPVYLYHLGYSVQDIVLFFVGVYGLYFFLLPLGAKIVSRIGYEPAILYSTIFMFLYYVCLFFVADYHWLIFVAPISFALQKMLYWPAYHADFASFSIASEQGREVGGLLSSIFLISILAPFIGGFVLNFFGFPVLFFISALLIFFSNIPLLITREPFRPRSFSYTKAYKRMFQKKSIRYVLGYMGYGEELISMVLWPVFVSLVITNYFRLGGLFALAALFTAVVTLYIGKVTDRKSTHKQKVLRIGTVLLFFSWILRLPSASAVQIFLLDSMYKLSKNIVSVPLMALVYNHAKNHTIMNTVVFYELSLVTGKLFTGVLLYILLFFYPGWEAVFITGAVMTLLYAFLREKKE